jgi:hypothetical protein
VPNLYSLAGRLVSKEVYEKARGINQIVKVKKAPVLKKESIVKKAVKKVVDAVKPSN